MKQEKFSVVKSDKQTKEYVKKNSGDDKRKLGKDANARAIS